VVAALADAFAAIAEPGAGLFDDIFGDAEVDQIAFAGGAFAVENVKLGLAEGRGDLVLDDLDAGAVANDGVSVFNGSDTADVDAHGGVELEGASAGGGFRAAEHNANLFANLIYEDEAGAGFCDYAGELAEGLRHEACVKPHVIVAHFAFEFGLGDEGGDGIDN